MTFGRTLQSLLHNNGYSLVSEFVTADRRNAVRLRELQSSRVIAMYHGDAIELARGEATIAAIVHRNRLVSDFAPAAGSAGQLADRGNGDGNAVVRVAREAGRSSHVAVSDRVSRS